MTGAAVLAAPALAREVVDASAPTDLAVTIYRNPDRSPDEALELDGTLQVSSFHPDFQFAGTAPDDIGNYTNRAPFPTLHLLREASIDRAVQAFPNAESIFEKNIETLELLGHAGWDALGLTPFKESP